MGVSYIIPHYITLLKGEGYGVPYFFYKFVRVNKMNEPYTDHDGKVWKTYREYCNSPDLDFDIICVMLETGRRTPQNQEERNLLKGLIEEKKKYPGAIWEIPAD